MLTVGAWTRNYAYGMTGTLGEDLELDSDNLGWTLRSWKYELDYNGYRGAMKLDLPVLGDAARTEIRLFQGESGLADDGVIGPATARALLRARLAHAAMNYRVPELVLGGVVSHESAFDVGAIGFVDPGDRGLTQQHVYPGGAINLSQAIRPALAVPRLAAQIGRLAAVWDLDAAIASWNVGEGGAEWWWSQGKPASGSPTWWSSGDLADRATRYVSAVKAFTE